MRVRTITAPPAHGQIAASRAGRSGRQADVHRRLSLLLLVLALLITACFGEGVNEGDLNVFSAEEEARLGEQAAAEVLTQVELVQDEAVQAYVADVAADLIATTEMADADWTVTVIEEATINAFALPGGHVFVHSGLVGAVGSQAELAAVLAHEIAHVEARHSTERMTKARGVAELAGLIGDDGELERLAEDIAAAGIAAKFSRDDEREADALGVSHLAAAGYEPSAMVDFLELLNRTADRRPNLVERFFGTHPVTEERIDDVAALAADVQAADRQVSPDPARLDDIQRRLGTGS